MGVLVLVHGMHPVRPGGDVDVRADLAFLDQNAIALVDLQILDRVFVSVADCLDSLGRFDHHGARQAAFDFFLDFGAPLFREPLEILGVADARAKRMRST